MMRQTPGSDRLSAPGDDRPTAPVTSEVGEVLAGLARRYPNDRIGARLSFHLIVDDEEWAVRLGPDAAGVSAGPPAAADCEVRLSKALFIELASGRRSASPMDFLTGAIRASNPLLLKDLADALRG
jgi:hypothetical protein